jgi:hypothetical protein
MNKTTIVIICMFVVVCSGSYMTSASSVDWARLQAYFSWMEEDGSWYEWVGCTTENSSMLDEIHLKIGQPVKCKMTGYTFQRCILEFEIWEPGPVGSEAYNVIEGKAHDDAAIFYVDEHWKAIYLDPNSSVENTWVLIPNGNFTEGNAPLNAFWQITTPSVDDEEFTGNFGFTQAYIDDVQWTGPAYNPSGTNDNGDSNNGDTNTNGDSKKSTPGFELSLIFLSLLIALIFISLIHKKKR